MAGPETERKRLAEVAAVRSLSLSLTAFERRRRIKYWVLLCIAALSAALAAQLGAAIAARYGYVLVHTGFPVAVATLLVLALGALWLRVGRRGVVSLAFLLDRRAALGQAYGTAIDVAIGQGDPGLVGRVLMRRVASTAETLDQARLEPILDRRMGLALLMLIALSVALMLMPSLPAPTTVAMGGAGEGDRLSADRSALTEAVERLEADASELDNAYLDAVARALRETLASDAASDTDISRAPELDRQIAELLEHAARAYGDKVPQWLSSPSEDRLDGLAERLDKFAAAEARAIAEAAEAASQRSSDFYQRPEELSERYAGRDTDELVTGSGASPPADGAEPGGPEAGSSDEPQVRPLGQQELAFAGRVPVGAALQSGKGESNQAGLGSEVLEVDTGYTEIDAGPGEEVVVSSGPQTGGNRIRIEMAPEAETDTAVAGAAGQIAGSGPGIIGPFERSYVPPERLPLVARYLQRGPS